MADMIVNHRLEKRKKFLSFTLITEACLIS